MLMIMTIVTITTAITRRPTNGPVYSKQQTNNILLPLCYYHYAIIHILLSLCTIIVISVIDMLVLYQCTNILMYCSHIMPLVYGPVYSKQQTNIIYDTTTTTTNTNNNTNNTHS